MKTCLEEVMIQIDRWGLEDYIQVHEHRKYQGRSQAIAGQIAGGYYLGPIDAWKFMCVNRSKLVWLPAKREKPSTLLLLERDSDCRRERCMDSASAFTT